MRPTFRTKVRVGHKSNTDYRNNSRSGEFLTGEEINGLILKVKDRGAKVIEFTGGEPTMLKSLPEHIRLCRNAGIGTAVVTNGTAGKNATSKLLSAGVQEFVVEVFGSADTQEKIIGLNKVREHQERFCNQVKGKASIRFRYEILQDTVADIAETAKWMAGFKPFMVDFVVTPYEVWDKDNALNMDLLEMQLNEAAAVLEYEKVGVNIRHYPMCRVEPIFRKNICNFKHMLFDPYEYDRGIEPRNERAYLVAGDQFSTDYEFKEAPCKACAIHAQCGGAPRALVESVGKSFLRPVEVSETEEDGTEKAGDDPFYERRMNKACLQDERQAEGVCDPDEKAAESDKPDKEDADAPVIVRRPEDEGKLCIFTVCDSVDQWFVPMFLFCLKKEYPEYRPVVLVRGEIDPDMDRLCVDTDVRQLENDEYPSGELVTSVLRYLIEDETVKSFPYVLITDFDRLIFRESPSLFDQHKRAMESDGTQVYENWLLSQSSGPILQSTHFVTQEWWKKVADVLSQMREQLKQDGEKLLGPLSFPGGGLALGKVIQKAELPFPNPAAKLWRSHGIKMKVWGNIQLKNLRMNVFEKALVQRLMKDSVFLTIAERCAKSSPEVKEMMRKWRVVIK